MDQAAEVQAGLAHATNVYADLAKPVLGSLGAFAAAAASYSLLYVFGFNRAKEESQTIQLINYRLDVIDRLQKLEANYVDRYRVVQFHAIEQDIEKYIHARTSNTGFEGIKDRGVLVRYFILPMPKGLGPMLISMLYYYAGVVLTALAAAVIVSPFMEEGWYAEIAFAPLALFVGGIAAILRQLAFAMRRRHEHKRFKVDGGQFTQAAAA